VVGAPKESDVQARTRDMVIVGGDHNVFSFRPIPFYGDYRTPIAGPYLYGGTIPGGGIMGVPGRYAVTVVVRDSRQMRARERARVVWGRASPSR
jgi:phytoene dehydrogenase-like protein